MFDNPDIALADLPRVDDVEWRPLAANYVRRLQAQAVLTGGAIFAGLLAAYFLPLPVPLPAALLPMVIGLLLLLAVNVTWPVISVPRMAYAIRERDLVARSGVFRRSVSAVPFNRVQHVETSSGPLDRYFGLATLQLFTAGGSGADLRIHGLPAEVAERMRVFVLERAGEETEGD